jgi:hypothetical protein
MGEIGPEAFLDPFRTILPPHVSQIIQPHERAGLDEHRDYLVTKPNPEAANDRYRANCFQCFWNIR